MMPFPSTSLPFGWNLWIAARLMTLYAKRRPLDEILRRATPEAGMRAYADLPPAEIVAAPLRGPTGLPDRLLGLYQPLSTEGDEAKAVQGLVVRAMTPATTPAARRAALTLAAIDGRRIA